PARPRAAPWSRNAPGTAATRSRAASRQGSPSWSPCPSAFWFAFARAKLAPVRRKERAHADRLIGGGEPCPRRRAVRHAAPRQPGHARCHARPVRPRRAARARDLGLEITRDAAANLYMTWPGRDRAAKRVIVGSHLDSVPHGGNFDGAAGVIAGLAAIDALKRLGLEPACDLTVMAIRAEESVWFEVSYIGSRGALGTLPEGAM